MCESERRRRIVGWDGIAMITFAICLSLFYANPGKCDCVASVPVTEINEVVNRDGSVQLVQVVWWSWHGKSDVVIVPGVYCRGWRLLREVELIEYERGGCWCVWTDGERRCGVYSPRGPWITQTWHDVEVADREFLSSEKRKLFK